MLDTSLLSFYEHPIYKIAPIFNTGTHMHVDPLDTDSINVLFVGHKWWVIFPTDIYEWKTELACDEQCSDFVTYGHYGPGKIDKRDADQANMLWFKHMLPQIR